MNRDFYIAVIVLINCLLLFIHIQTSLHDYYFHYRQSSEDLYEAQRRNKQHQHREQQQEYSSDYMRPTPSTGTVRCCLTIHYDVAALVLLSVPVLYTV